MGYDMDYDVLNVIKDTVFEKRIDDGLDYISIPLDRIAQEELLQTVPIVKKCYQVVKTAMSVREWFFCKKILIFASNLQNGKLSADYLVNYGAKLEKDHKRMYKELEYIMVIIDSQLEYEKIKYYANLYSAVINPKQIFDWYDFRFMVDILNRMSIYDLNSFTDLYNKKAYIKNDTYDPIAMKRLSGIGLAEYSDGNLLSDGYIAKINGLGNKFFEVCIEN